MKAILLASVCLFMLFNGCAKEQIPVTSRIYNSGFSTVTNVLFKWASSLENGYTLSAEESLPGARTVKFRLYHHQAVTTKFADSACIKEKNRAYYAVINFEISTISAETTKLAVAINAQRIVPKRSFNFHTFWFDKTSIEYLPRCPADEQALLDQIGRLFE